MNDSDLDSEQRAHFRLRYPEAERPSCRVDDHCFRVSELSEGGMRLVLILPEVDMTWDGLHTFDAVLELTDSHIKVHAEFLRVVGREVVFKLNPGVDMRCMLTEQKRLVRKYPAMFGREEDD